MDYTVGFAFNKELDKVLLLLKKRGPPDLVGAFNGPGGRVHSGETLVRCMVREFTEETGIKTTESDWVQCHIVHKPNGDTVSYFATDKLDCSKALTTTDEMVALLELNSRLPLSSSTPLGILWCPYADGVSCSAREHAERLSAQLDIVNKTKHLSLDLSLAVKQLRALHL